MKLLLLTTNYPPVSGGVSRYYRGLVENASGAIGVGGIDSGPPCPFKMNSLVSRIFQVHWAYKIAVTTPSDVAIIAGQPHLAIGVWAAGRKFSLGIHGGEWEDYPLGNRFLKKMMDKASSIFTSSLATAEEWVPSQNRMKTISVTPGLPAFGLNLLSASQVCTAVKKSRSSFEILTVSRPSPRKGIQKLVDAIQICRQQGLDVYLNVAGQDQGNIQIDPAIGGVHFLGRINDDELANHYLQAQAFALLPERTRGGEGWEGFGIVYLEAAAAGLPIIATNTGGVREAIDPVGTLVLDVNCDSALVALTIEQLVQDESTQKTMSKANTEWANNARWEMKLPEIVYLVNHTLAAHA